MTFMTLAQMLMSVFSHLLVMVVLWAGPSALALAYLQHNQLAPEARPLWTLVALVPVLGPLAVMLSYWPRKAKPL